MMSVPSAIMQPGSVTTSIIRFGVQKLTLTPNQKVAPLRHTHSGFDADCASSALSSLSSLPARPPPMVMGKMQFNRTLVLGLKIVSSGLFVACAGVGIDRKGVVVGKSGSVR